MVIWCCMMLYHNYKPLKKSLGCTSKSKSIGFQCGIPAAHGNVTAAIFWMLAVRLLPSASWVLRLWTARLMAQTSPRELVPPKPDDFVAGDFGQSWWLKLSNSQVIKKNWAPKPSNYGLDNIFNIAIRTLLAIPWYSVFLRQPQILFRFLRQTTSSANDLG